MFQFGNESEKLSHDETCSHQNNRNQSGHTEIFRNTRKHSFRVTPELQATQCVEIGRTVAFHQIVSFTSVELIRNSLISPKTGMRFYFGDGIYVAERRVILNLIVACLIRHAACVATKQTLTSGTCVRALVFECWSS